MVRTSRVLVLMLASACAGVALGGYLFARSQPRSILALDHCERCLSPADLAGLLASVGLQRFTKLIPFVAFETNRTLAIKIPLPGRAHYVIVPKKDIKAIADISAADADYVVDAMLVARHLIERDRLTNYHLYTNGPGVQQVTYLHFHLVAQ